ncbi:MAG: UDP-N-acetylmuramyl-tripeptide synthetase, partial [Actinobacteria bacterium]|nr:UDP-N-acetylmuramyl-tripeptide synthetase [Actinomycetota bacterium]
MLLSELLDAIEEKKTFYFRDIEVSGLAYDSRETGPGEAFFCIKGLVTDGHQYIRNAVKNGAAVIFVEREPDEDIEDIIFIKVPDTRYALARCSSKFYGDPSRKLILVGITGTNGKTTTTYLVKSLFDCAGYKTGMIGTIENYIGDKSEEVTRTTPESLDLQRLLGRMVEAGVEMTVMEVSSHALELHRAASCDFDVVVFTNLTQDHLDFHLSLEDYFMAKRKLFIGKEYGAGRVALLNTDDHFGRRLKNETDIESRSYGVYQEADYRAADVDTGPKGSRFKVVIENGFLDV